MNAGEEVGVVPGEPQPRPGVGLRAGGGAELGGDEVPEVLLGGAPADVLLHRLEHPPVHRRRGRHRPAWAGHEAAERAGAGVSDSLTAWFAHSKRGEAVKASWWANLQSGPHIPLFYSAPASPDF